MPTFTQQIIQRITGIDVFIEPWHRPDLGFFGFDQVKHEARHREYMDWRGQTATRYIPAAREVWFMGRHVVIGRE